LLARSACSVSDCELTETYSPAAMDMAPATSPAIPAISISELEAEAAATPTITLAVETSPSLAPSTAAPQPADARYKVTFGMRTAHDFPPGTTFEFHVLGTVLEIVPCLRRFLCGRLSLCAARCRRSVRSRSRSSSAGPSRRTPWIFTSTGRRADQNLIIGDAALGADRTIVSQRLLSGSDARGCAGRSVNGACSAGQLGSPH